MPPPAGVDKRVGLIDALAGTGESHLERYRRICRRAKVPEQVPTRPQTPKSTFQEGVGTPKSPCATTLLAGKRALEGRMPMI